MWTAESCGKDVVSWLLGQAWACVICNKDSGWASCLFRRYPDEKPTLSTARFWVATSGFCLEVWPSASLDPCKSWLFLRASVAASCFSAASVSLRAAACASSCSCFILSFAASACQIKMSYSAPIIWHATLWTSGALLHTTLCLFASVQVRTWVTRWSGHQLYKSLEKT